MGMVEGIGFLVGYGKFITRIGNLRERKSVPMIDTSPFLNERRTNKARNTSRKGAPSLEVSYKKHSVN